MEAPILQITVVKGPKKGEILVCKPEFRIQIGRVFRGNNWALHDPGISQKHLCFRFIQEDSRWFVSDLDTSNGTILNGSRIRASVLVPVSDGDVFQIGEKTELRVKIVTPGVLEEKEEGNNVNGRRVTRRVGSLRVNTRAASSGVSEEEVGVKEAQSGVLAPVRGRRNNVRAISARVSNEEEKKEETLNPDLVSNEVGVKEAQSRVSAPVRGRRNNAGAISARVSNEEEKKEETLNPDLVSGSGVEMGQKGRGRGKRNAVRKNLARVLGEGKEETRDSVMFSYSETEEPDQNREVKLRRNPSRSNSSRVLKDLGVNCAVDAVLEVKEVGMKRKGRGRGKGKGKASTVSEEERENGDNLVLEIESKNCDSDSVVIPELRKGIKARTSGNSSMVILEKEGEEDVGVKEGEERNSEEVRADFENVTLNQWFDSMELFLPKVIYDESEKIIEILKGKARKFDELPEAGSDVA